MSWNPTVGAWPEGEGIRFRVWAPAAGSVEVEVTRREEASRAYRLERFSDGSFSTLVAGAGAGDRYRYRLDDKPFSPDVASRHQPDGVHGPSEIVDPSTFRWSDENWRGIDPRELAFYELHVGTFTPQGTFASAAQQLPALRELGVTAVELMPLGDFPGEHNWGYDGVALFAPARCYGAPDDLRRFVDAAHQQGLAVFLDVVYNHLGPDGNYLGAFSPYYFSTRHHTPWGPAINFDGEQSGPVRQFFIENALHWLHEYHFDGLRLDATHAILDDSGQHILAELAARVEECFAEPGRRVLLIAEDSRNLAHMVKPGSEGGWGLDGIWADDFHHQVRRLLAGDRDGYFQDYSGTTADIATTVRQGWFYCGQYSEYLERPRGSDPAGLGPEKFVICIQNHDQVGNRAFGDRLHHSVDAAAYRAASVLLLCSPETPLLFMGQEWACSSPFQFFTDHHEELGRQVTAGRRREFRRFAAFTDPKIRETIPDPQARKTFENSRLDWGEREAEPHAAILRLYARLLKLRREWPAMHSGDSFQVEAVSEGMVLMRRAAPGGASKRTDGGDLLVAVQLRGNGSVDLKRHSWAAPAAGCGWRVILSTEDSQSCRDGSPVSMEPGTAGPTTIAFSRPGAVIFQQTLLEGAAP